MITLSLRRSFPKSHTSYRCLEQPALAHFWKERRYMRFAETPSLKLHDIIFLLSFFFFSPYTLYTLTFKGFHLYSQDNRKLGGDYLI